jgi:hypothetical protein
LNVASTFAQFVGRLAIDKTFSHSYRGALITSKCKNEQMLLALSWVGVGLIVLMTCLHMKTLFLFDVELNTNLRLPPRIANNIAPELAKPEIVLKENNGESLFQQAKQDLPVITPLKSPIEQDGRPKIAPRYIRQWQLHIQRSALSETLANNEIANAARQLQAGDVSLAQRVFQALLTADPHSVEAMEGMRLAFRQLGDAESEQKYLEMLRLEIPDYDFDRNESLISGID